jgi:type VI secretion system secreted protein Hcp
MAIDSYMYFQTYDNNFLTSESQVSFSKGPKDNVTVVDPFVKAYQSKLDANKKTSGLFEVEDYSFDIEQVLNIGSQSSGAGAGKVTFNPFSITRKIDCSSATFFGMACSGTPFKEVGLGMRKSAGGEVSGTMFLSFTFKLVAVKTVSWAHDDESPKETVTFEYGGLLVSYLQQMPSGDMLPVPSKGWNRVKNIAADTYDSPNLAIV